MVGMFGYRNLSYLSLLSSLVFTFVNATPQDHLTDAQRILRENPLIDGHNDFLYEIRAAFDNKIENDAFQGAFENGTLPGQFDLPRAKAGGYSGAFWSAYYPCPTNVTSYTDEDYDPILRATIQQLDTYDRLGELYPDNFPTLPDGAHYTPDTESARADFAAGKFISPLAIEGLHQAGNIPSAVRTYYNLGARYITLTWNCHNQYADAAVQSFPDGSVAAPPLHYGLSDRGRQIVLEMNRVGMIVDLSHVAANTMRDVLAGIHGTPGTNQELPPPEGSAPASDWKGSIAPPIFSHSSVYAICPHPRNVPDDVLQLVKQRNSVVMINFNPGFISCAFPPNATNSTLPSPVPENATLARAADHIQYVGDYIGYEHVGIGSDWDGIESTPTGLEDVSKVPALVAELLDRGISEEDIIAVLAGNVLRVWSEVEKVSHDLESQNTLQLEDYTVGFPGTAG